MRFENNRSGNGGFITLNNETDEIGRLTYTIFPDDHKLIISFVLVHPQFEGRGMGKFLVEDAIKFARENGWNLSTLLLRACSNEQDGWGRRRVATAVKMKTQRIILGLYFIAYPFVHL